MWELLTSSPETVTLIALLIVGGVFMGLDSDKMAPYRYPALFSGLGVVAMSVALYFYTDRSEFDPFQDPMKNGGSQGQQEEPMADEGVGKEENVKKTAKGTFREESETKETMDAIASQAEDEEEGKLKRSFRRISDRQFRECRECPVMTIVPAGSFTMGARAHDDMAKPTEFPRVTVTFEKPYAIGTYEVTVGQFDHFLTATGYKISGRCTVNGERNGGNHVLKPGFKQSMNHPAVCVTWHDATAYVEWLAKDLDKPYRLVSAAEWENAARARTTTLYSTGSTLIDTQARINERGRPANGTLPVGSFPANDFGIYDMHGNAEEWTNDCWTPTMDGKPLDGAPLVLTQEADCRARVVRGGAWYDLAKFARASARRRRPTDYETNGMGFRVMREIPEVGRDGELSIARDGLRGSNAVQQN